MNSKTKRFLFNNVGGLIAVAAVFMEAGSLREKLNAVIVTQSTNEVTINSIKDTVQDVKTDVAVLKARVATVESNGHKGAQ